ncbi:MAG: SDR family NAD(P)-dependent oxidoreductase [Caulobacteraceae bacterium]|nr:SDR family NAD(P)-dependent oxidoreductase [Caulobacteraceae bacterium]
MQGKTVVVTGATSGIGQVAAEALARKGARIVFVARSPAKAVAQLERLSAINPDVAHDFVQADLSTLAAMKLAGDGLAAKAPRIHVLINNAGAIFDRRELTPDGLERTFAVNHMAYFVVTERLRPNLAEVARIVSTASGAHALGRLDFDDLQSERRFGAMRAYGASKLCNILWTRELGRRLAGTGVTANCFHPGGVNTGFGSGTHGPMSSLFNLARPFLLTPEKGADTLVWLATAPEAQGSTGGYWSRRRLQQPSAAARDDAAAARLWAMSEAIANRVAAPA